MSCIIWVSYNNVETKKLQFQSSNVLKLFVQLNKQLETMEIVELFDICVNAVVSSGHQGFYAMQNFKCPSP